jgi:hypothetical protein
MQIDDVRLTGIVSRVTENPTAAKPCRGYSFKFQILAFSSAGKRTRSMVNPRCLSFSAASTPA